MKKKELEQRLIEIDNRLKALGDLNTLLQQSQGLPTLISDTQTQKSNIEKFLNELPAHSEEINRLVAEAKGLNEQVTVRNNETSEISLQIGELQKKVEGLAEEAKVQLGVAANAKLASTFEQVKGDLGEDKWKWFKWLTWAVVILILATASIVVWQIKDEGTLYRLDFLIKLALTSPFVYFVVFVNREYNRTRSLIEEYTFKAAIARSFEAYKQIIQEADSGSAAKTLEFVIESIKDLYSSPMVNIKNNAIKEKSNSPDVLSKVQSIIPEEN